ncbi:MAG: RlmE family RNA methyltransferase [Alphaproteobacteria bacterium]|nr:RlmE family RNA methyltransferase [Alphaproteobacteria bacterium]
MLGKRGVGIKGRDKTGRLNTDKKRSVSSARWLQRQINDPYVAEAHRLHYRSRAAFKLIQLDDRFRLFRPGRKVIDLGAAPGSWSQVASMRVKAGQSCGRVIAIDLLEMEHIAGVDFLQMDFLDETAQERVQALLCGKADLVMSDMAANATGHQQTDHLKIMVLCEAALSFARCVLNEEGSFIAKVLRGGTEPELLAGMKKDFSLIKHVKPDASRADSAEIYVVATGFRDSARN